MRRLVAAGMSEAEARRKELAFARAVRALAELSPGEPGDVRAWFVPGRVEFLGKHTDYAGGRSLVCATEQGFCLVARPRSEAGLRIVDAATGARCALPLRADLELRSGEWSVYPGSVARRLSRDFGVSRGMDLSFASDLPAAAGLSSSSALVVGTFLALADINRLHQRVDFLHALPDLLAVAGYLGAAENGKAFDRFPPDTGVGTQGGSQDQTAILCSEPGRLLQVSFDPVRLERRVPFPPGHCLVIGFSGIRAEKSGATRSAYNAAAEAVQAIHHRWLEETGREDHSLGAALASTSDARERLIAMVAREPSLRARLEQFLAESEEIIPAAGEALARGALGALGALVERSQAGAERGLGNQTPETMHLARTARRLGAVAASAFGAGFGGSVWALVGTPTAEDFLNQWGNDYRAAFPDRGSAARFFLTLPGPAALHLT